MRRVDDIVLNQEIVANEERGSRLVGVYAAHARRGQDDHLRTLGRKESADLGLICEIQLIACTEHQLSVTPGGQNSDHGRPNQSTVTGNIDSRGLSELQGYYSW